MSKTMNKLALAISITSVAFEKKLDKAGEPYILHCLRVMNATVGDECTKCASVMHDLIEDTEYTFADLSKLGFSDKTIGLLHLLTHQKETPYDEYIKAISVSNEATEIEKYHRSYIYLKNR